jgi:hypothetical protein
MSRIVGHYAPWLLTALVGALIVVTLVPAAAGHLGWEVLALAFIAVVFLALSLFAHNRHLCERCIASVPLDASATAGRYAFRFRVTHLFERRLFAVCYLAAVAGCSFLYADPVGKYCWAAAEASLAYLLSVYVTHQRLQPWCPYCRSGGEEQTAPTAPTPVATQL